MGQIVDLTHKTFDRLFVEGIAPRKAKCGHTYWYCRCECGNRKIVSGSNLRRGQVRSCGCLQKERTAAAHRGKTVYKKHGHSCQNGQRQRTPEYSSWQHMRQRCNNPNTDCAHNYIERGIAICEEWSEFENFLRDMGPKPTPKHTLERKDNNKGYSKDNCVWATRAEQNRNYRRNRYFTAYGRTFVLTDWARLLGVCYATLKFHVNKGRTIEWAADHFKVNLLATLRKNEK